MARVGGFRDHVDEFFVAIDEVFQAIFSIECGYCSVADDDYVGFYLSEVFLESLESFFRWSEVASGVSEDCVTTPS